ncbi:hypothetical protein KVF89_22585 [Nocardioides carbamazepini]|uniref:hypothetical protein n=1 Tax=Nocardioides carbamazepini TaxID=2854259 RepID=UPI00214A7A4C|nr:hypothetical protein [Nocardioides carbamazepini]MCR1785345.1 hypothetical protein [Nocardioides carbamazepini]
MTTSVLPLASPTAARRARLLQLYALHQKVEAEIRREEAVLAKVARKAPLLRRSRYDQPPCATEQGYQWHRYRKHDLTGDPCGCQAAHRQHNRREYARQRDAALGGAA